MTQEFDHVRAAFASSFAGRFLLGAERCVESAWASSAFHSMMQRAANRWISSNDSVRTIAIATAIAAAMQPLLISMMPATVRPSMPPVVFLVVAVAAAVVAMRPDAVVRAWPQSRLARWLRG